MKPLTLLFIFAVFLGLGTNVWMTSVPDPSILCTNPKDRKDDPTVYELKIFTDQKYIDYICIKTGKYEEVKKVLELPLHPDKAEILNTYNHLSFLLAETSKKLNNSEAQKLGDLRCWTPSEFLDLQLYLRAFVNNLDANVSSSLNDHNRELFIKALTIVADGRAPHLPDFPKDAVSLFKFQFIQDFLDALNQVPLETWLQFERVYAYNCAARTASQDDMQLGHQVVDKMRITYETLNRYPVILRARILRYPGTLTLRLAESFIRRTTYEEGCNFLPVGQGFEKFSQLYQHLLRFQQLCKEQGDEKYGAWKGYFEKHLSNMDQVLRMGDTLQGWKVFKQVRKA